MYKIPILIFLGIAFLVFQETVLSLPILVCLFFLALDIVKDVQNEMPLL